MKIDLSINIDDVAVGEMYNRFCEDNECESCCCQVLIDECYKGCFEKYKELHLKSDIEYRANLLFR